MRPKTFVAMLLAGMLAGGAADAVSGYLSEEAPAKSAGGVADPAAERAAALD